MKRAALVLVLGLAWGAGFVLAAGEKPAVWIVLAAHGDQFNRALERDSDADRVTALLEKKLSEENVKDRNVTVWLENGTPQPLYYSYSDDESQRYFYRDVAEEIGVKPHEVPLLLIGHGPGGEATARRLDEALRFLYDKALKVESARRAGPAADGESYQPFIGKIIGLLKERQGDAHVTVASETSPYEAWREILRFGVYEDFSGLLFAEGKAEEGLECEYEAADAMLRSILLRDKKLAEDIRAKRTKTDASLHVVVRGTSHVFLEKELGTWGVPAETYPVGRPEELSPFQQYVYDASLHGRRPPNDVETRRRLAIGMMTRFVETHLMQLGVAGDREKTKRLYDRMSALSAEQVEQWLGRIKASAATGGPAPADTWAWLTSIYPELKEDFGA